MGADGQPDGGRRIGASAGIFCPQTVASYVADPPDGSAKSHCSLAVRESLRKVTWRRVLFWIYLLVVLYNIVILPWVLGFQIWPLPLGYLISQVLCEVIFIGEQFLFRV